MCVLLQTAGSVRLSVESLEATFLLFSSCLSHVTRLWHSTPDPVYFERVCAHRCMWDFFFFHVFHVSNIMSGLLCSALPLTVSLTQKVSTRTQTHTHSGRGSLNGRTHRQAGIQFFSARLSSAVLFSSAFEVDSDSWMLEEPRAPLAEEKAQRNINELRLDMVMQAYAHTVNASLLSCRDGEGQGKKTFPQRRIDPKLRA